jgi:PAS domain S-box-containing protein
MRYALTYSLQTISSVYKNLKILFSKFASHLTFLSTRIVVQILLSFVLIGLFSIVGLAISIRSLNQISVAQQKIENVTVPFLSKAQDLSQQVRSYVVLVERLQNSKTSNKALKQELSTQEIRLKTTLSSLHTNGLAKHSKTEKLSHLFKTIFENTRTLEQQKFKLVPLYQALFEQNKQATEKSLRLGLISIKRFQINNLQNSIDPKLIQIRNQYIELQAIVGQLNDQMSQNVILRFQQSYIQRVRVISKQIVNITHAPLRKTLAQSADPLLSQITPNKAIFHYLLQLFEQSQKLKIITSQNQLLQSNLNENILSFLNDVRYETQSEFSNIERDISQNILTLYFVTGLIFLASIIFVAFYVYPKFVARLKRLSNDTQKIANGDFETKIDTSGNNEISQMSQALEEFKLGLIAKEATEKEMKDTKKFQDLIMEHIPDLIFVKDSTYRIIEANPAFLNVYPQDMRDNVIGTTTFEKYDQKEVEAFLIYDRQALEEGSSETEEKINFPNGETKTLYTKKVRFEDSSGSSFVLGVSRDITEINQVQTSLKESEERLKGVVADLEKANIDLKRFNFVASHDLQEPLKKLQQFSSFLEEDCSEQLSKDGHYFLGVIKASSKRMSQLIKDLLSYSRNSSSELKLVEVDLSKIVENIIFELEVMISETQAEIQVGKLPIITGDPTALEHLLRNLINNAIKYHHPERKPKIEITSYKSESKKITNLLVCDNGIGLDMKYSDRIFEPFQRLHNEADYPGSGIGLAICNTICQRHGWNINVASKLGKGSKFKISILSAKNNQHNK